MRGIHVNPPGHVAQSTSYGKHAKRSIVVSVSVMLFVVSVCLAAAGVLAQEFGQQGNQGNFPQIDQASLSLDTGPRGAPVGAGNPIQGLTTQQTAFFTNGMMQFNEVEGVALPSPGNGGLGPTFNSNSCGSCHSQPATGGSSPSLTAFPNVGNNPQATVGQLMGGGSPVPFFITADGPVREARFKSDGGVHDLFTIAGRSDAPNCTAGMMAPPDFTAEAANGNLSLRIPTPVFGAGLIENIPEKTILDNLAVSASRQLGISGVPNRSGNDGTITRFGWKAQNKSLLMFAGEAYNVEMGITNELFPNERGYPPNPIPPACNLNPTPEDRTIFESTDPTQVPSDVAAFANFMRFLDQPTPACGGTSGITCSLQIQAGAAVFTRVGCANCHTPSLTTATSEFAPAALSGVQANLFSDLALHHMGARLADGITQGKAGPDMFRTSPLWGLGQRVFFLHDGRTSNLVQAIREHASFGSEANQVILNFALLSPQGQQNLIMFLRSL